MAAPSQPGLRASPEAAAAVRICCLRRPRQAFLRFQLYPYKDLGMETNCLSDLTDVCGQLTDPRAANAKHKLTNILILAILGVLAGANTWGAVAAHARDRRDLLAELLDLSAGIPSHDTFSRLFRLLDPDAFERLFSMIITSLHNAATTAASTGAEQRELLSAAIDGKVSRRSFRGVDKKNPIHMVSAWSSESGLVLGQLSTHAKSNEITAIPKLLDTVDVRGVVVTIDAMGCQRDIAKKIIDKGGDYILQIKGNQPTLEQETADAFEELPITAKSTPRPVETGHGRMESRTLEAMPAAAAGVDPELWPGAKTVIRLRSVRSVGSECSAEDRYYLTSLGDGDPDDLLRRCRGHWGIENSVHWCLDMTFREDESRVREGHGAENVSRLRRLTLNLLLPAKKALKRSLEQTRLKCAWDFDFLIRVATGRVQAA